MGDEPKTIDELLAEQEQWQQNVSMAFCSIRTSNDMTQTAFASALGLSQSYVSEIENGSKVPSTETLTRLLNYVEGDTDGTAL